MYLVGAGYSSCTLPLSRPGISRPKAQAGGTEMCGPEPGALTRPGSAYRLAGVQGEPGTEGGVQQGMKTR